MIIRAQIPRVFAPLMQPDLRYLGAWGGRGSGKSHFFAWRMIRKAILEPGLRAVCIREIQRTLKESSKRLIEDKLREFNLGETQGFKVYSEHIETPGRGIIIFMGMQDSSAENIKSLENYGVAWVEEAQTLSQRSLDLLRPTIRAPGSQLWFSWNPRRKTDPIDKLLKGAEIPSAAAVVRANFNNNPLFPEVLEQERQDCLRIAPDQYPHIWEGEYLSILSGAYYARQINAARSEGRIGKVAQDPLLPVKIAVDIGGTGAKADAFVIWVFQNVGKEIRILNYYEAVGQPLATHLEWLRANKYTERNSRIFLPHDGSTQDKVFAISYESALQAAGYEVEVIPNQGKGAAAARIECARRMFPSCWFNQETTQPGIDALGWYHEKIDETRQIGLGAEHDWSSHGADAFGLLCLVSEQATSSSQFSRKLDYSNINRGALCR